VEVAKAEQRAQIFHPSNLPPFQSSILWYNRALSHVRTKCAMPEKKTLENARRAKEEGKAPSTQAGEFVREEIEHVRQGKHGARSTKQAIAIGLSKARRAGVKLPPPKKGAVSEETRRKAQREYERAQHGERRPTSRKRSRATTKALSREGHAAASKEALSKQTRSAARQRSHSDKSSASRKGARTRAQNR
jgi:Family of unknown function (DUF6496)